MAVTLTVNGTSYSFPNKGDEEPAVDWGVTVTNWATGVSQGTLQKNGANFTLTAVGDFGAAFGVKATNFSSRAVNPADAGIFRLANNEKIAWRNAANGANIHWNVNASDLLESNGHVGALSFSSISANPAAAGIFKLASGERVAWRNAGNTTDVYFEGVNDGADVIQTTVGLKASYFKPVSGTAAATGTFRLANAASVNWRNAGDSADLGLTLDSSNILASTAPMQSSYFITASTFPAQSGVIRLSENDVIAWRNAAQSADATFARSYNASVGDYFTTVGGAQQVGVESLYFAGPLRAFGGWVAGARIRIENAEGIAWLNAAGNNLVAISVTSNNDFYFTANARAPAFASQTGGVALSGVVRLAQDDKIVWPDSTFSGEAYLTKRSGDYFQWKANQDATGIPADGYSSAQWLTPEYYANSPTVLARHNYIVLADPIVDVDTTITDACVMAFDAAAGTHKAVDGATVKVTPGAVDAWIKTNVNGTIYYVPAYLSKVT